MFPDLAPQLQDAARIEITHQDKTTAIARHGDAWGLVDRGGYPVQASKLRGMLTALTELRLVEPRTTDPDAVQPARPGRSRTARTERRTCCACSTHPASRSSR